MTGIYTVISEDEKQATFLQEVIVEVGNSTLKHGELNSVHESYAVLLEEVDEYWDLVKAQKHDYEHMRRELKQIAAMAVKTVMMLERKTKT